ncbi:MAG: RNA-protein complex protein Nop10 [Candidatus Altiarchaeota archaeon]|nr:RNA-protein complex protein Nop10 [Candidatus Altiarchaeota archaeon]
MKIRKCPVCGTYSLQESCSECFSRTVSPRPARFSPIDPYGAYRREMKRGMLKDAHKENSP